MRLQEDFVMDTGLKGCVALVTASSQGIGRAVALGLAREGANLVMCARRKDVLQAAADEIARETGVEALALTCDVQDADTARFLVASTVERFGRLDVLVNNAGGPPHGEFASHSDEAWQKTFEINLLSVVRLVREALPYLRVSGRGRVINLSSTSVKQPIDGLILSNSIRAGVIGLAKTLSIELAPHGITVNNIAPGSIDTERIRDLDRARAAALNITEEEARRANLSRIPMGRYGSSEEVANLAVFLASDKASYITGTTIQVDGGLIKSLL
jgi:3-oxoacyl-[acyl-carrier protein] reductase